MSDELLSIQSRHAEDNAEGPFAGRRSEQARQDRAWLLAELTSLRLAVRLLLANVNSRHPAKQPHEWECKHFAELDRLVNAPREKR